MKPRSNELIEYIPTYGDDGSAGIEGWGGIQHD